MVRAAESYSACRGFKSLLRYHPLLAKCADQGDRPDGRLLDRPGSVRVLIGSCPGQGAASACPPAGDSETGATPGSADTPPGRRAPMVEAATNRRGRPTAFPVTRRDVGADGSGRPGPGRMCLSSDAGLGPVQSALRRPQAAPAPRHSSHHPDLKRVSHFLQEIADFLHRRGCGVWRLSVSSAPPTGRRRLVGFGTWVLGGGFGEVSPGLRFGFLVSVGGRLAGSGVLRICSLRDAAVFVSGV